MKDFNEHKMNSKGQVSIMRLLYVSLNVNVNVPPLRGHEAMIVFLSHYQQTDLID